MPRVDSESQPPQATSGPQQGLTSSEAVSRLLESGRNLLPIRQAIPAWRQLTGQFIHFFAIMLWIAGALAILAGMPQLGVAIFVVIVLNGIFAFLQEHRAERASEKLKDLLPRRAMVIRDGTRREIDASELVAGDVVILREGDRISADMSIIEAAALSVDASTMTGETIPVVPQPGDGVLAGTFVVEGQALAMVSATGDKTRLAAVARLAETGHRARTPLAEELDRVVRIISIASLSTGVTFLAIAAIVGIRWTDAFLFALGVVVALVPEGLLPTVTLSLAWGAQRMAAHNALVRRLEAVQTLGSATFICTDKTGTLTLNEMSVVDIWTPLCRISIPGSGYDPTATLNVDPSQFSVLANLAQSAAYCSNGRAIQRAGKWVAQGNSLEVALDVFARRLGLHSEPEVYSVQVSAFFPFDRRRKRMSAVVAGMLHVKGAPESVLPRCKASAAAEAVVQEMAQRGLRVIAVARRPAGEIPPAATPDEIETDLDLLGLMGIEDPPRPEVAESIAACRRAGLSVAMITGDHAETARAIARQVGLLVAEDGVIDASHLPADEASLGTWVDRDGIVVSRVTPEDKLRIARALQARGHVVGMTGDGVNDGPALQEASIGIAMGRSGTDVAREAADLVLLDDNFATIVAAIEQGRSTFANIRRFLTYHLTDNVAELAPFVVWALSGGKFPLALGILQVLSLDIGTDILPALALGAELPNTNVLERPSRGVHLLDSAVLLRAFAVLGLTEALVEMTAFLISMHASGWRLGTAFPTGLPLAAASGAAFAAVVIGQMANAFACRSVTRGPGELGWTTNRPLIYAVFAELLLLLMFLYFRPIAVLLGQAPPLFGGAVVAVLAFPTVLLVDRLHKYLRKTHAPSRTADL